MREVLPVTSASFEAIVDPKASAQAAGLVYVSDEKAGIRRKRSGKGFRYETGQGQRLEEGATLQRIRSLGVPPAWTDLSAS
jgi:DNA topoisomerase I